MSERARLALFAPAVAGLAALLGWGLSGLPAFGSFAGATALLINHLVVGQTHATDAVTAVNFSYRAIDTLGEEFILFASVVGLAVLLREQRDERARPPARVADDHRLGDASAAVRAVTLLAIGPVVVLSLYIDAHGAITPGGGFQGGVVGAAALLLAFLGAGYLAMRRASPHALVEAGEAAGAAAYGLIGLGGVIFATDFFANFLGLGSPGELVSAGTIPLSSLSVGLEVSAAFVLMWGEFVDQALIVRPR